jgi:hypothetical protein
VHLNCLRKLAGTHGAACCMQKPGQALEYGGSWVEHLNNAGISVAAHDMQSCGFSDGVGGRRSFFTAFEDLVSDTLQFRRCHMTANTVCSSCARQCEHAATRMR